MRIVLILRNHLLNCLSRLISFHHKISVQCVSTAQGSLCICTKNFPDTSVVMEIYICVVLGVWCSFLNSEFKNYCCTIYLWWNTCKKMVWKYCFVDEWEFIVNSTPTPLFEGDLIKVTLIQR